MDIYGYFKKFFQETKNKTVFLIFETFISVYFIYLLINKLFFNFFLNTDLYNHLYAHFPQTSFGVIKSLFFSPDHYVFLLPLYENLSVKYLSQFLNIHPQVCIEKYTCIFLFISFIFWLFAISQNLLKYLKKEIFIPAAAVLILPFLIYLIDNSRFLWVFYSIVWYIGYIAISFFPILSINLTEYFYVKNEKLSKNQIILITCLIVLSAFAHEYYKFLILGSTLLMILADKLFIKRESGYKKTFLIYAICLVVYLLPMFLSNMFNSEYSTRFEHFALSEFIDYSKYYLNLFIDTVIMNNMYLILPLIVLYSFAVLPKTDLKKTLEQKRFCIFTISVFFSNFLFYLLLVFHSEEQYCGNILMIQSGLIFVCKLTLFNLILSALGFVLYVNNAVIRKFLAIFLIIFSFAFSFKFREEYKITTEMFCYNANYLKKNMYIMEKVYCLSKQNNDEYIYLYNRGNFNFFDIEYYFYNLYNKKPISKPNKIKTKYLCDASYLDECMARIKNVAKERYNYRFSEQELEKSDFSELYKYSENKRL